MLRCMRFSARFSSSTAQLDVAVLAVPRQPRPRRHRLLQPLRRLVQRLPRAPLPKYFTSKLREAQRLLSSARKQHSKLSDLIDEVDRPAWHGRALEVHRMKKQRLHYKDRISALLGAVRRERRSRGCARRP